MPRGPLQGVGTCGSSAPNPTLILHWNCGAWVVVPSPNPVDRNSLIGVAAASADDVWTVGYQYNAGAYQTLIVHPQ